MSRVLTSLKFAQEQHASLAAVSVGDERVLHLSLADEALQVLEVLHTCRYFNGTYSLTWSKP